jgi:hypothetical protein
MEENKTGAEHTAAHEKKIDQETAENEFISFCENNEIEYTEAAMNDEELKTFSEIKQRFIRACMAGRVEVDGTSIKYTISKYSSDGFRGETVTIKRPGGQAFSAMDGFKEEKSISRLLAYMSSMTGKDLKYFSKIDGSDWKFISGIASLFLSL